MPFDYGWLAVGRLRAHSYTATILIDEFDAGGPQGALQSVPKISRYGPSPPLEIHNRRKADTRSFSQIRLGHS